MNPVEYTDKPSRFLLTALPDGRVKIDLRENIVQKIREDAENQTEAGIIDNGRVVWEADEYSLTRHYRRNLAEDVEANFDTYLAEAKAEAEEREIEAECTAYEKEMSRNLPGILLDYDFRLMMLEEMGL